MLPVQSKKEETQSVVNLLNIENEQEDTRGSEVSELRINANSQVNNFKINNVASDLSNHDSLDLIISNEYEPLNSAALVNFEYTTDRGHYPIDIVDPNIKKFIVAYGSCRPKGPFPRDNKIRCFFASYYNTTTRQV